MTEAPDTVAPGSDGPGTAGWGATGIGSSGVRRSLRSLVSVVGPTSLITALLFYFGWVRTRTQAADLGLEVSMLDTSTRTTLLRSLSSVYQPLGALLLVAVISLLGHWALSNWIRSPVADDAARRNRARWVRRIAAALAVAAVIILAIGIRGALVEQWEASLWPLGPICLGAGIALGSYAVDIWLKFGAGTERAGTDPELRWIPTLIATLVVLLVVSALFWAVADYAEAVGHRQHRTLIGNLAFRPDVIVYSQRPLLLDTEQVKAETLSEEAPEAYRFQYSGLKLLFRDNGRYFLLPETWTQGESSAIVLPDESWLRYEFVKGDGR